MHVQFKIKRTFLVSPETLYQSWLDSKLHSEMTGGEANCSDELDGLFDAWDGYITGKNMLLIKGEKIVQKWRTADFAPDDEDSEITLNFSTAENGCELVLTHTNIPDNQPNYEQGWEDHYFTPMANYFNK